MRYHVVIVNPLHNNSCSYKLIAKVSPQRELTLIIKTNIFVKKTLSVPLFSEGPAKVRLDGFPNTVHVYVVFLIFQLLLFV